MFNSMTVGDNVALPLREFTDLPEATIGIQVRMKLGQVDLAGFEDLKPDQLSGGMKKRAALADRREPRRQVHLPARVHPSTREPDEGRGLREGRRPDVQVDG